MALYNNSRCLQRVTGWQASRRPLMCLSQVKASWRASSAVASWLAARARLAVLPVVAAVSAALHRRG